MTLTLLIDLDDTLLQNDINRFVPAYLKALSGHMARYSEPLRFAEALMAGTRLMMTTHSPNRTLQETFDAYFFPALGLQREAVQAEIDDFYRRIFPELQSLTKPQPGAQDLIAHAHQNSWQVVIATNPIFPRIAIEHRLAWAGLPPAQHPFALIPSYEVFHFSKPAPEYYAEVLANIGWPQAPVLMVGNDPDLDIDPARQIGLPTFWVTSAPNGAVGGELTTLLPWLDTVSEQTLYPALNSPRAALATLRTTPAVLQGWGNVLAGETWQMPLSPGEWSLAATLCHLRDSDIEVNRPRLESILKRENPFIPAVDTDHWAEERGYHLTDGPTALHEFLDSRQALLTLLNDLPPDAWQRPMRHSIFGPGTLAELVCFMAEHDRIHLRTIYASGHIAPQNP
ncbi:MAG: hypothetical protein Fur0018_09210 [Anaerolineales bacterium]